jgi:thiol-disulfide isomerase/thioredoxin
MALQNGGKSNMCAGRSVVKISGEQSAGWRAVGAGLLLAVAMASALMTMEAAQEPVAAPATTAPEFKLKTIDGQVVTRSEFKGKALLLVFWASWDEPSRLLMPRLAALQREYAPDGFSVIGISLDGFSVAGPADAETHEINLKGFAIEHKLNFPILMGDYKVIRDFGGLEFIPTSLLLDAHHNVVEKFIGAREKAELEAALEKLFAK